MASMSARFVLNARPAARPQRCVRVRAAADTSTAAPSYALTVGPSNYVELRPKFEVKDENLDAFKV